MAVTIRAARPGDGSGMVRAWASAADYYADLDPEHFQRPQLQGLAESFEGSIARAGNDVLLLVAELDRHAVGWLAARIQLPDEDAAAQLMREPGWTRLAIDVLIVDTPAWRHGAGTALLTAAESWGRDRGAHVARLGTYAHSPVSVPFYENRMGYERRAIIYQKNLGYSGMRGYGGDVAGGVAHVVIAAAYGGPEVLSVTEEPVPEPGPGEARIEVRAAGVNPVDVKSYSGAFGTDPARLPIRLGAEAAGVVTAVGPGTTGPAGPVSAGDEVIAYRAPGAYATELVVPAGAVVPKPAALDWAQAAGLMLTGVTAWHLLVATAVAAGDTVLIHGGSGGVGLMAVQLAVIRGAKVVATASPARHGLLAELGAVPVAYGPGLAERVAVAAPGGVDVALDLVGTDEAWDVSLGLVADRARVATIVAFGKGLTAGIKVLGGAPGADPGTEIRERARLDLARLAGEGRLRVIVSQTFPLAEAAAAHHAIRDGHTTGKIALIS